MLLRVWQYDVPTHRREEFEREYGPSGSWARLFAASPGFVATTLSADVDSPTSYLTVDRFVDDDAWQRFRADHGGADRELAERLRHLPRTKKSSFEARVVSGCRSAACELRTA